MTGATLGRELSWPRTRVRIRFGRISALSGFCLGSRLERHRFRFMSAVQGRKHALAVLDHFSAAETVEDLSGECEERYVVDGSFEEIPLDRPFTFFRGPCTDPGSHSLRRVVRSEMPDN